MVLLFEIKIKSSQEVKRPIIHELPDDDDDEVCNSI